MCAPSVFSYSVLCLSVSQSVSPARLAQWAMPCPVVVRARAKAHHPRIYWGDCGAARRCSLLQIIIIIIFSFFSLSLCFSISLSVFSLIANASYFISALFSLPCSVLFFLFLFQFFFWYCLCVFNLFFNYFCGWFFHWNRARLLSPCFLAELPVPVPVHQATVAGSVRGHCLSLNEQHELPPSQVFPIDQHFFECISFLLGDNFWHGDLFTNTRE